MELFAQTQHKSRLGQILLDKRLVSQEQLSKAMERQATTGERLGDILTQWNVVTQRHIESALRAQRALRLVAYLTTATMSPFITACGGGGGAETSQPTQSTVTQPVSTAVVAATPSTTESGAPNTAPSISGWVIKESVCCAPGTDNTSNAGASIAAASSTATASASTPSQTAVVPTTSVATQTTSTASPPVNVDATAPNAAYVEVSWTSNSENATTYRIYRNGSSTPLAEISGTTFYDNAVTANSTYTYQIRAVDGSSNPSTASNIASVTTPSLVSTSTCL